jgi:hypothetical protein
LISIGQRGCNVVNKVSAKVDEVRRANEIQKLNKKNKKNSGWVPCADMIMIA